MERPISQVSSSDDADRPKAGQSMTTKPPWQRLLWKKQPYPDNYVPDSFLDGLRTNSSIHLPPLRSIILSSLPISLQFSLILILISTFYHLRYGSLEASELLLISLSLLSIGWITLLSIQAFTLKESIDIKPLQMRFKFSYILLPLILLALSPVLRTLTEATTDDSIWALSSILFFTNWSLADYTDVKPSRLKNKTNDENDQEKIPKNLISASNPISSPSIPSRRFSFKDQPPPLSPSTSIKSSPTRPPNRLLPVPLPTGPSLPPTPPPLPSSLSLNASISASVVLASRLSSSFQVFNLIFFSSILFVGVPRWRTKALEFSLIEIVLSEKSSNLDDQQNVNPSKLPASPSINPSTQSNSNTSNLHDQKQTSSKPKSIPNLNLNLFLKIFPPLLSISISLFLLSTISKQVTFLSLMVVIFISLICPIWMKWAQRWKNEMRGPWDVGIIRVRS